MSDETSNENPLAALGLNINSLFEKAREFQTNIEAARAKAANIEVEGSAGGGMVVVRANGLGEIIRVTIEESLLADGDKEMLEDLIVAGTNIALRSAKQAMQEAVGSATGMAMPPGFLGAIGD